MIGRLLAWLRGGDTTDSTDEPAHPADDTSHSTDEPAHSTDDPAHSTDKPAHSANENADSTDEDDESGFVGSLLDRSVFVGHGGSTAGDRELESVAEEAEKLSETRDR